MLTRRRLFSGLAALGVLAGGAGWVRGVNARYYEGPITDHWDGTVFSNPGKPRNQGMLDLLRWQLGGGRASWPSSVAVTPTKPPAAVEGAEVRVTMVGHATLLLQTRGLSILTDPVWSERASPASFAGPKRVTVPGIAFDDLPKIDLVLVSHNHYDHLDTATLGRLWQRDRPRILAPLGNDAIIRAAHPEIDVDTLDWRDVRDVGRGVRVHLHEMHHWSARGILDRNKALWGAFVIETPDGRIYHVGDSGYGGGDTFRSARERFGGFRLAILPIGAYEPRWFMSYSHMNPSEAVRAALDCGAATVVGHHWGTFQLTNEAIDAPPAALAEALRAEGLPSDFVRLPRPGEAVVIV